MINGNGKKVSLGVLIMALATVASGSWALATTFNGYKITNIDEQTERNKTDITELETDSRKYALDIADVKKDISHIKEAVDKLVLDNE